jgi:hypothetical protein
MHHSISVVSDRANKAALVSLLKAACHLFGATKPSPVVAIGVMKRSFEGVSIHICSGCEVTLWAAWHLRQFKDSHKKSWPNLSQGREQTKWFEVSGG